MLWQFVEDVSTFQGYQLESKELGRSAPAHNFNFYFLA